jgi:hypothetical protein
MVGHLRRVLSALGVLGIVATLLAGCGGARTAGLPAAAPAPPRGGAAKQRVTLRIGIPKRSGSGVARHPQYISPATTQMTVNVQTGCPGACTSVGGFPQTVALTTSSGNCTSTLASTNCTLTMALGAGSYVMTLTTQDAGGTALSTAQGVPVTVLEGQANTISVSLSGVPETIVAALVGATGPVLINALDADGNIIVGPGAPTYSVAATGGVAVTLVQPPTTQPNLFGATLASAGTADLTVTASYNGSGVTNACTQSGAVCSENIQLTATAPPLASINTTAGTVSVLDSPYSSAAATISSGLNFPLASVFNSGNDLFVSNQTGIIQEYAPPYTGGPIASINVGCVVLSLAVDAEDDLYAATSNCNEVYVSPPPYTSGFTITSGISKAYAAMITPSGDLVVVNTPSGGDSMAIFTPPFSAGSTPTATVTTNIVGVNALATDDLSDIFVADGTLEAVEFFQAPYTQTTYEAISGATLNNPYGMALDTSGDLFVANSAGSGTNANTVIEFGSSITTISSGVREPTSIAVSSFGALAVDNFGNGTMTIYSSPYSTPSATDSVAGTASVSEAQQLAFGQATLTLTMRGSRSCSGCVPA